MTLHGKVALVTGSTSGIGQGIAAALAEQGATIVLTGFGDPDAIESGRAALATTHAVRVLYLPADVSRPAEIRALIAQTHAALGALDILVNNAGIQFTAPIEEFPDEKWDQILAINLSSAFHATKAAIPAMKHKGWGRIVNIASAHALVASPLKAAYVTAKHGLLGLTKVTALETATTGITCNAICPGWALTPLVEQQLIDRAGREHEPLEEIKRRLLTEKQPLAEFTTPAQIGALTAFLCSDAARTITGVPVSIDGGWTSQ